VSWTGKQIKGERLPSSETALHQAILLKRADLGAVVHTHSPMASALACAGKDLPVCVEDMAQIIGGTVKCAGYVPGGRHQELADSAAKAIGGEATAVLLSNHGPVVGGRNLREAVVASEVLEKAAGLFIRAESLGGCRKIPDEMIREERHRFLFKYGREYPVEVKE
jgi:L-fuculose-phosphate aldolase